MSFGETMNRRTILAAGAATVALALPGCSSMGGYSLVEAVRRLLERSTRLAFARLMAPGGFWDSQVARLDLPEVFGARGGVLQAILTTAPVRTRLQRELNHVAEDGARRAAPLVADAVRTIGIANAKALLRGGPVAATGFLRDSMGGSLVEAMVPALADGMKLARDPVVGQALAALTGVDLAGAARSLAVSADEAIWGEIGREETAIRANPESTNDPVLIAAFRLM